MTDRRDASLLLPGDVDRTRYGGGMLFAFFGGPGREREVSWWAGRKAGGEARSVQLSKPLLRQARSESGNDATSVSVEMLKWVGPL